MNEPQSAIYIYIDSIEESRWIDSIELNEQINFHLFTITFDLNFSPYPSSLSLSLFLLLLSLFFSLASLYNNNNDDDSVCWIYLNNWLFFCILFVSIKSSNSSIHPCIHSYIHLYSVCIFRFIDSFSQSIETIEKHIHTYNHIWIHTYVPFNKI